MNLFEPGPFAPFINGAYGVSVIFLIAIAILTFTRYRKATKRLAAAGGAEK